MGEERKVVTNENESKTPEDDDMLTEPDATTENDEMHQVEDMETRLEIDDLKSKIKNLEDKNEQLVEEAKDNYNKYVRTAADFENYKKRSVKEFNDLKKFANEQFFRELLSVVDNLERAIDSGYKSDCADSTLLEGVEITLKDVLATLEKNNVKGFISKGKPFDPSFHQAMMQEETDDFPENTVISEMQKGYTIHDRLLRPAMVIVSKPASEPEKSDRNSAAD